MAVGHAVDRCRGVSRLVQDGELIWTFWRLQGSATAKDDFCDTN
jgi:hypothetical protein